MIENQFLIGIIGLLGCVMKVSVHVPSSDGTSSSLRWYSSVVHVHQNELVHWTSLVQLFNFSQRTKRNGWTVELA